MADGLDGLFSGVGSLIGGGLASDTLGQGMNAVSALGQEGVALLEPYRNAGTEVMPGIKDTLIGDSVGSDSIGLGRINQEGNPLDFEKFAKDFNMSEGAQYTLDVASKAQDATAGARGGLLSGANQRAQTEIAEGIANKDLLSQYQAMLAGEKQDFGEREASFGNLFGQESLGEKAAGAQAISLAETARAMGGLYGQQANANASKGSGIGGIMGGVGSLLAK